MTSAEVRIDAVVVSCALSAGIHAALVPQHLREGLGPGAAFALSAALLAGCAIALTRRPERSVVRAATATVLGGLLAAYAAGTTAGLPLLHPEPEPVTGLGLATKAIEAAGLLVLLAGVRPAATSRPRAKGTIT
ncbi:MAG TPA: hypothetical protein VNJ53_00320 [Gaiellaceae bacterium]|nr:hypothetical protein [Gaiellaceae bacterium]